MRIRADFGVGHPADEVWALLASDDGPSCVPGLQLDPPGGGSIAFNVEARRMVFEGTAAVATDERARTVTVEAKGVERSGRGRARTTLMLRVDDDGLFSTVNIEADLHLSGDVASLARLIAEAVYRMADQVAECLDEKLGADARPEGPGPVRAGGDPEPAAGWLRRLIDRFGPARTGGER